MKVIRIKLEYGCFPVWIYSENNELIENDLPVGLVGDTEIEPIFVHIQEIFDSLYLNDTKEFKYIGFRDQEQRELFEKELSAAINLLKSKLNEEYMIDVVEEPDVIDRMLQYLNSMDKDAVLINNVQLSEKDLNVIIIKILSWLKLEYKRSIWISEGRKTCYKPLQIDTKYPWCANLCMLVEKESLFQNNFRIVDGKFDFANSVNEMERMLAREKAYKGYNPQKHT